MTDELGKAELELGADLAPLEADLRDAKTRVALAVGEMQKMLDSLHADIDFKAKALEAAAARMASAGVPGAPGAAGSSTVARGNDIWGVRGPEHPGSLQNPLVTVMAAGKYFPMGSYAAAVGDSNQTDAQGAQNAESSTMPTAADYALLTAAIHDLANNASPGSRLAAAGVAGLGEPNSAQRVQVTLEDQDSQALRDMAAAISRLESHQASGGHTILVEGAAGRKNATFVSGPGGTTISGPQGEQVVRIDGPQFSELVSAILARGGGGGGGGGGNTTNRFYGMGPAERRVDMYYHADPNTGGGGAAGGAGLLAALGLGTGAFGKFAGIGTAASFAGFGFEHFLTTLLGIGGSAVSALGGGGLLAAGALGQTAVGAGSNAAVMKSTISDTQALSQALTAVTQAQQVYGKNSTQAATATAQLNAQMLALGNTAGVQAELGLAKAGQALDHFFDIKTSSARVQAVNLMMQAIQLGYTMVPLIAQAAERNLAIINSSIKPLFQWLEGPQGIQIWNDLENHFAHDLPTAVHAFTQAVELVLRIVDLASGQTGGFIASLDHLATRLNNLDSATLDATVQRLIGDFRLWEKFVKYLIDDIYLLFHQDVGTGNSIITALTTMLEHLHAYETSATGSAQIQNIFMVHKTEILELIAVLRDLSDTFGHIYLAVAPALVTVMNDAVLPALKAVADVVAFLAGKSQILATLMGLALITSKMGGIGAVPKILGGGAGFLTGAGTAAAAGGSTAGAAAEGAGGAAAIGGLPKLLGLLPGLSAEGVAAAATAALPLVLAGGGAAVVIGLISNALPPGGTIAHASPGHLTPVTQGTPTPAVAGRFGSVGGDFTSPKSSTLEIKDVGDYAHYSATQLAALIQEIKQYGSIKVNGVNEPKEQVLQLAEAALKAKDAWNQSFNEAWTAVNTFYRNTSRTLPALYDDFNSNMKLIAHTMGLNSDQGRQLVADNITKMVNAVTTGMLLGQVSVKSGMAAIKQSLQSGMQDNAITWKTQWNSMFTALDSLYSTGKISSTTFYADLGSITKTGMQHITADNKTALDQQLADLKQQQQDGLLTQGQYSAKVHSANQAANAQERTDMNIFAGQVLTAMTAAGVSSNNGTQAIFKPLNAALVALGQKPLSLVSVGTSDVANAVSQGVQNLIGPLIPGHATGAVVKAPMVMVGEEAPQHPEVVIASNPAYRRRNLGLWATAGKMLGIPGFAQGGVVSYGQLEGLWDQAGGNPSMAALMAAIAEAESGGNPTAHNPSGASGLWQILGVPFPGNVYDPLTNARMAVAKYLSQGLGAWTTYTSGAYKQFLNGKVGAVAGGAGVGTISAPSVKGTGALAKIVHAALGKEVGAANAFLSHFGGSSAGSGAGGALPGGTGGSAAHRAYAALRPERTDQGVDFGGAGGVGAVAAGNVLSSGLWGGWPGTGGLVYKTADGNVYIMEDFAPGVQPGQTLTAGQFVGTATGGPEGIETGWANAAGTGPLTPYSGHADGTAMPGGQAFRRFIGYAQGGIIPGLAEGGIFGPGGPSLVGTAFAASAAAAQDPIGSAMGRISSLIGSDGDVSKLTDLMSYWQGMWALNGTVSNIMSGGSSAAILTDASGNPYIDQADVNTAIAQLSQEVGWEGRIVGDLQTALHLSRILPPKIQKQIKAYQAKIAAIKKKIQENVKRINALNKMINTEQGRKKPNYHAIGTWKNQILALETENYQLGGNKTVVGTGGQIGSLTGQISTLQNDLQTVQGYPDQIGGAGGSGLGGELGPAQVTLAQLSQELGALSPGALQTALATAQAQTASTSSGSSALASLLEQQNTILAGQYEVSQAQYKVLAGPTFGLPPFGGSFLNGGVIPGPPGAPRTVIAHGGETVLPAGAGDVNIHAHGPTQGLLDLIDFRIEKAGRQQARVARRQLPGRAGALLPS